MSSPIPIPSSALYVPIHRRTPSSPGSSPSPSSRALPPSPPPTHAHTPGVYSLAELIALSHSPLIPALSAPHVDALRAAAPEVVQTRKQRKALVWRARQPAHGHRRTSSRGSSSSSASEDDEVVSWRRT